MIKIIFRNLEKSEIAKEAALDRIQTAVDRFPDLSKSEVKVTLSMENSPFQTGPDLFRVKVHIDKGRYRGITLDKSASNLYVALADIVEHLLERLNRFGDKSRVKERSLSRKVSRRALKTDSGA